MIEWKRRDETCDTCLLSKYVGMAFAKDTWAWTVYFESLLILKQQLVIC